MSETSTEIVTGKNAFKTPNEIQLRLALPNREESMKRLQWTRGSRVQKE